MILTHLVMFKFWTGASTQSGPTPPVDPGAWGGGGVVVNTIELWRDVYVRHRRRRILKQQGVIPRS